MQLTRNLKALLIAYKEQLPADQYQSFESHVSNLMAGFMEDLSNYSPGIKRGLRTHELLEAEIAKASHIKTTCGKGCSGCCHFEVEITADDAEVLADHLRTSGLNFDHARLNQLAKRQKNDSAWQKGLVPENRCLFLSEAGACRVYASRPTSCRKLSVTTPSNECTDPSGMPQPLIIPVAEILMSAAINLVNNSFGAMAKMIEHRVMSDAAEILPEISIEEGAETSRDNPKLPDLQWS
jgi:Fe-S-cluster containining protein